MKLQTILKLPDCRVLSEGRPEREVTRVFCCDLLSIAMSRAPSDSMVAVGNKNTVAVASLADVACIVLAEGVSMDRDSLEKASEEGIAVLSTELPVFDMALNIYRAGME
ncbi:MAG: DRTGG domain-containing protein [Mediterraneibacter sp.]